MGGSAVSTIRFDLDLPTGPVAVDIDDGVVVGVRQAAAGEGRAATAAEAASFLAHLLGEGDFVYPVAIDTLPPFHRRVLAVLRTVPVGETRSYGWLACAAGNGRAARAVGAAMARNPFPLLYPCHRIVRSDGSLGEYGFGGPMVKEALLAWEREARSRRSTTS
jgi:methylated-DNA-[protein]-cysteine S-methyltransferase